MISAAISLVSCKLKFFPGHKNDGGGILQECVRASFNFMEKQFAL